MTTIKVSFYYMIGTCVFNCVSVCDTERISPRHKRTVWNAIVFVFDIQILCVGYQVCTLNNSRHGWRMVIHKVGGSMRALELQSIGHLNRNN